MSPGISWWKEHRAPGSHSITASKPTQRKAHEIKGTYPRWGQSSEDHKGKLSSERISLDYDLKTHAHLTNESNVRLLLLLLQEDYEKI